MTSILKLHSYYSLLSGTASPQDIVSKINDFGYKSAAITELDNVYSFVQFFKECKDKKIKPILGCELKIKKDNNITNLTVLAKNLNGWKGLIKTISFANLPENNGLINNEQLSKEIAEFCNNNWIIYFGAYNSYNINVLFDNFRESVRSNEYEIVKKNVCKSYEGIYRDNINFLKQHFGKENVFLEVQTLEKNDIPLFDILTKITRYIGEKTNTKVIATTNQFYINEEDADDQRILLASQLKTTFKDINTAIDKQNRFDIIPFFKGRFGYIPTQETFKNNYLENELKNNEEIANICEEFNILSGPRLPEFKHENKTSKEYFIELCRKGWNNKIKNKIHKDKQPTYIERVKTELSVLEKANLFDYFLIVQDFIQWAKNNGWLVGLCRGSVGGCLTAYLTNITEIDPIEYNLLFERFYNEGRNSPGKVSLPDIDTDFPISKREFVKDYIKNKYGKDKVAAIATFGSLKGRAALKEVLRIKNSVSFLEMNRITENIPDESKISGELQEMEEKEGESSIIKWALENNKNKLKEWCFLNDKNEIDGPLSLDFAQAIRLEGCKKSRGRHAAGIIITKEPTEETCPIVYDEKTNEVIAALEMKDVEMIGHVKMDILGVAALDHMMDWISYMRTGKPYEGTI